DGVALLHGLAGLDVQLPHDPGYLRHHRNLHLHRLQDADLVALGDHLSLFDDYLPDVRGDLRSDFGHGRDRTRGSNGEHTVFPPGALDALARGDPQTAGDRSTRVGRIDDVVELGVAGGDVRIDVGADLLGELEPPGGAFVVVIDRLELLAVDDV